MGKRPTAISRATVKWVTASNRLGDVDEIGVYAVLEKLLDGEFKFPYQGNYLAQRQHNAGFNRVYYRDPPAYSYIPEYTNDNASHISGRTLAVELLQRLKAKISW